MSFGVPTGAVGSAVQAGRELFSLLLPARIEGLEKASSRFFIEPEHEKTRQDAYAGAEQQIDGGSVWPGRCASSRSAALRRSRAM